MEAHVLMALLVAGPVSSTGRDARTVQWTAEFTTEKRCEDAGTALVRQHTSNGGPYVVNVSYVCMPK